MSEIYITGTGAVSPAGWGRSALLSAAISPAPLPAQNFARPGWTRPLRVHPVPPPATRPAFLAHPRLRRTSPVSQYAVAAAMEALGEDQASVTQGSLSLGIVCCVMSGCVNYSRRFYDEVLRDPSTASPLLFPETVFNAPSSHLAALLGATGPNYTLVGDPGTFLQGLALASEWLNDRRVDACLVVGTEELDWLTADALRLFARSWHLAAGAGALYLRREAPAAKVRLGGITDAVLYTDKTPRATAPARIRQQFPAPASADFLCDSQTGIRRIDAAENAAWQDWPGNRCSVRRQLGEGLMAASAWQCVVAVESVAAQQCSRAFVPVTGSNEHSVGAWFESSGSDNPA